jgi:hypothetical protein
MCGRFLNKLPVAEIARIFGTRNPVANYPERINITPTDPNIAAPGREMRMETATA